MGFLETTRKIGLGIVLTLVLLTLSVTSCAPDERGEGGTEESILVEEIGSSDIGSGGLTQSSESRETTTEHTIRLPKDEF